LDRQEKRGKTKYLVKWKGYMAEENTWEGLENLKNAMCYKMRVWTDFR